MIRTRSKPPASVQASSLEEQLAELYSRPGHLVRRVGQRATALFAKFCPEVTPRQYGALVILSKVDGLDQKQLASLLHVDQTNIGVIVRGLEKKGFVRRVSGVQDKRKYILTVTESGRLSFQAIRKKAKKVNQELLIRLSPSEIQTLSFLLKKIL